MDRFCPFSSITFPLCPSLDGWMASCAAYTYLFAMAKRLPWSRWHWLVCLALGISWVLDGLEVTTVGIIGDTLKKEGKEQKLHIHAPSSSLIFVKMQGTLGISSQQVGIIGSVYIAGAVFGSLLFGLLAGTATWIDHILRSALTNKQSLTKIYVGNHGCFARSLWAEEILCHYSCNNISINICHIILLELY